MQKQPTDPALEALDTVCAAADTAVRHAQLILDRAQYIRDRRAAGATFREIVCSERRPLIVELLTELDAQLADAGSRWRRAEARALHAEGMSMETIAELFGVTRQRVSSLLKQEHAAAELQAAVVAPVHGEGSR